MKVQVVTNENGQVISSMRVEENPSENAPSSGLVPLPGQQIHEVELPSHLLNIKSTDEYHQELEKLIKQKQG